MLHIPILRHGQRYESVEKIDLLHHATGQVVAQVSQANSGLPARDIGRMDDTVLERFTIAELMAICRKAAQLFMTANLPIGQSEQSFDDYIAQLSATTGMPMTYCRNNAAKIHQVMDDIAQVVTGLTRGFDLTILDTGFGQDGDRTLSYFREGRIFGAVLPSNSPGVHSLWVPAFVFKAPIVLKPGREEPWTPWRIIQAFIAAGAPAQAFGFYPTDHAGAGELLRCVNRSMLFGGGATVRPYQNDPAVELHGPGYSKVVLGDDAAEHWQDHLDVIASSILANGGRSCINASGVWTPKHGQVIAQALAERFAKIKALPAQDPEAQIAAFANPAVARGIDALIDQCLRDESAVDLTERVRGSSRLVEKDGLAWLLPTVVWCGDRQHALANTEYLFPFAAVVECPTADIPGAMGPSLVVSAITADKPFTTALMNAANVDRLNIGVIPTYRISWDQPHEGNLFEHLYRQRAFQTESAA
ncbi:MAG: aldehyde dehydrogenase family protein [Phycisphaerae bacterium]